MKNSGENALRGPIRKLLKMFLAQLLPLGTAMPLPKQSMRMQFITDFRLAIATAKVAAQTA